MKKMIAILLLLSLMASISVGLAEEGGKSLIIYFDYSENINTEGLDVDAMSTTI